MNKFQNDIFLFYSAVEWKSDCPTEIVNYCKYDEIDWSEDNTASALKPSIMSVTIVVAIVALLHQTFN